MNAHFFVQYTGRLLTQGDKGEIVQNFGSLVPSSDSSAWAGSSFACVKWKPETFRLSRHWLICLWPPSQANVELFFFFFLPFNLRVQCRNVFEGCRSRTSHWLALKKDLWTAKAALQSAIAFTSFGRDLRTCKRLCQVLQCVIAVEVSWSPGSLFSSEC